MSSAEGLLLLQGASCNAWPNGSEPLGCWHACRDLSSEDLAKLLAQVGHLQLPSILAATAAWTGRHRQSCPAFQPPPCRHLIRAGHPSFFA